MTTRILYEGSATATPALAREFEIRSEGLDVVLSHHPSDTKPTVFGLYIWTIPFNDSATALLTAGVEEYTGAKVKALTYKAGNGHGNVIVEYE